MFAQIVANLLHGLDSRWIDATGRPRASAECLNRIAAVDMSERFCHLTAVRVLDTDEDYSDHYSNPQLKHQRHRHFSSSTTITVRATLIYTALFPCEAICLFADKCKQ